MEFPEEELLAPGHRGCAGCGAAIAVRLALKALGRNTVVACATGCLDVMTSPYPETAWEVPWIHVAFENAGAVASGVESALNSGIENGFENIDYFDVAKDALIGGVTNAGNGLSKGAAKHMMTQGRQLTKNLGRKSLKKAVKYYYSQTKTIYYKALFTDAAADVNDAIYDAIYN